MAGAVLFLAVSAASMVFASESNSEEGGFDGYLFELSEPSPIYSFFFKGKVSEAKNIVENESEHIHDDIYWVKEKEDISALEKMGMVSYYEPNYYVTLFDGGDSNAGSNGWPYDLLNAAYANDWDINGRGVRVGVIDSGVDLANPNLQNANIEEGFDYIEGTSRIVDDIYHGTNVIQVIAGDNNSVGVTGISRGASIVPLKCFSKSSPGTVRYVVGAIYGAVDQYDCDIINMSWGLGSNSESLHNAVRYADSAGVIMVAAHGNVSSDYPQGTPMYPACYEEVLSVSAINASCAILSTSQTGNGVTVCAPGGKIPFVSESGTVTYSSGTSFAAPCITSEVALLLQLSPSMRRGAVTGLFSERAADLGDEGYDGTFGYGLPQIDKIIGLTWSAYKCFEEGSERIKVYGWFVSEDAGNVIIASYNSAGRMEEIRMAEGSGDGFSFEEILSGQGVDELSVYYLDSEMSPVSGSDHYVLK